MDHVTSSFDLLSRALVLRAQRQQVIATNIANADTPGYAARELDFNQALQEASASPNELRYEARVQPSLDGNSVDLDRERAKFADNAIRYESTLRFINAHVRTMLSAIQGQ